MATIPISVFDQSTPGPSGPITDWDLDWGDGSAHATGPGPWTHTYATPGTKTIALEVTGTSPDGTSSISHNATAVASTVLMADFVAETSGLDATLTDHSTPGPSGPITAWDVDWGDGSGHASGAGPWTHTYGSSGSKSVTLVVTGTSPDGTDSDTEAVPVATPPAPPPPSTYRPYIDASAFNKAIPTPAPIHPDTALMISSANHWLTGAEWLGPAGAKGSARTFYYRGDTSGLGTVQMYANNNGWVGAGPFTMPMPSWAAGVIGPYSQGGDSNVTIVDSITGDVWELNHCTPPGYAPRDSGGNSSHWNCSGYRHWSTSTVTTKGYATPSPSYVPGTSASKIQFACGLLVPEDLADCFSGSDPGTVIPHALHMDTFCGSSGTVHPKFVPPAGGGDGRQPNGIPAGARVQLDPSINVAGWASINAKPEPWRSALKKICRTLQVYGIIQVDSMSGPGVGCIDSGTELSVVQGGTTYAVGYRWPWDVSGFQWGNNGVPYDLMSHFRVIDWTKWTGV